MARKSKSSTTALVIHIDSELIIAAFVHSDGTIDNLQAVATPAGESVEAILQAILTLSRRLLAQAMDILVSGIGVSTVGLVHHTNGTVIRADESLSLLQNVSIGKVLHN